jgi:hypothetical protein
MIKMYALHRVFCSRLELFCDCTQYFLTSIDGVACRSGSDADSPTPKLTTVGDGFGPTLRQLAPQLQEHYCRRPLLTLDFASRRSWLDRISMVELNDFFNDGFGWKCRHCHRELEGNGSTHSRFFLEGEAESKQPELANAALAKWADAAQTTLTCPRCGITEPAEKA